MPVAASLLAVAALWISKWLLIGSKSRSACGHRRQVSFVQSGWYVELIKQNIIDAVAILAQEFGDNTLAMSDVQPTGPVQRGRGCNGHYVYWICFQHPNAETIAEQNLKTPRDFTRESFSALIVQAHRECGISIVQTATFQEPNANGKFHLNCLVLSQTQYRWLQVGKQLRCVRCLRIVFPPNEIGVFATCKAIVHCKHVRVNKPRLNSASIWLLHKVWTLDPSQPSTTTQQ